VTGPLQCLDPAAALHLAGAAGIAYHHLSGRRRARAREAVARSFPEWPPQRVAEVAERSFAHLFQLFLVDAMVMPRLLTPASWPEYVEFGSVTRALDDLVRGRSAIFVTGHCGNWELLGFALAMLGFPITALARPLDNPFIDRWLLGIRAARGMRVVTKWGASSVVDDLLAAGGQVGFIADQNAGDQGLFVPFFGRLASCYKSIGLLAMRHGVPIVAGHATRLRGLRYRIDVVDVIAPETWRDAADPLFYVTARTSRALETMVRAAPEQYLWLHRRWKSRPRFEREGRPMPDHLRRKLASLEWMTEEELERIERYSDAAPAPARTTGAARGASR
jgi:KDO2-lipid IV(A) lauroyltransferase